MDKEKEFEEFNDFIDENDTYEIVSMTDENGVVTEFIVIDAATVDNNKYMLVIASDEADDESAEATILKEVCLDGDEVVYELVEDDAEFNKVAIILQENDSDYEMEFN